MKAVCLSLALLMPLPIAAQTEVMTCGLENCDDLGNPYFGLDQATADRFRAVEARLSSITKDEWVEIVALAIGHGGCFKGWPSDTLNLQDYYDKAVIRMVSEMGLADDEAGFHEIYLTDRFYESLDALGAQGRMVSVTEYEDELIPAACAAKQ